MTIAAVIVTHQSEQWLPTTLTSVLNQTTPVDQIVIVDDSSTDHSRQIALDILGPKAHVVPARTTSPHLSTRIAANFQQGLRLCRDADAVILGDHDDVWHPHRVEHQIELLYTNDVDMVASDGVLVDEQGSPVSGTLRSVFRVPQEWWQGSPRMRMRIALRRSIATGGASAVRPRAFSDRDIPERWLHDRWWSLVATARERMMLDVAAVIDYRVLRSQQVGLDRALQASGTARRMGRAVTSIPTTYRRLSELRSGLARDATGQTAPELHLGSLLRNLR